jgi:hypothetical protein
VPVLELGVVAGLCGWHGMGMGVLRERIIAFTFMLGDAEDGFGCR